MPKKRRQGPPRNISEVLIMSGRLSPRIDALYALIVRDAGGHEGIVRRDTPLGTIPYITDDSGLVERMIGLAKAEAPFAADELRIAKFARVEDIRTIERPAEPAPDPGPAPTMPEGPP